MARQGRGQWAVPAVNAVVAGTVLLLVAVLALVVKPPAPPGIAAFAPQASKPITKAPPGQSSVSGEGPGECAEGQVCAGPSATPSASASAASSAVPSPTAARGVPSALQCYEWPDGSVTQTFDPQSPTCIASWDEAKGNGGATSMGVTSSEVQVALPVSSSLSNWPAMKPMVDFVNSRYQLYGRKIRIVPFVSQQATEQGQGTFNDPVAQRADAAQAVSLKPFATFDFVDPLHYSMSLPVFRSTVARGKVISLAGGDTVAFGTARELDQLSPYAWSYYPTIDVLLANVAEMTCRSLVGKPAVHAPDRALRGKTRKLAIVMPTDESMGGPIPGLSQLSRSLETCTGQSVKVVRFVGSAGNQASNTATMQQLSRDGVTSVVLMTTGGNATNHPMGIAAQVGFRPEWIMAGQHKYLVDNSAHVPSQTVGAFGVGTWNKMPQLELEQWVQAFTTAGGDPSIVSSGVLTAGRAFYAELQMVAAGIQLAGPDLTPESFAAGLRSAGAFPNPGAGAAPFYQGTVGFAPGDVTMMDDFAAFWMTTEMSAQDVNNSKNNNTYKASCYVGLGRRFRVGTWPTVDRYYRGGCR